MARRLRVTSTSKSRGLSIMEQFLLCRERDGTWAIYAPRPSITADFPLLAFGKSLMQQIMQTQNEFSAFYNPKPKILI
jgi:hypothetical protein